jgi:hypothetical protein
MMKKVLVFDENGDYIEDKIENDDYEPKVNEFACSPDTVIAFYKPKLIGGQVVEGLTQEEINELKNTPSEPSPTDLLQQRIDLIQAALDDLLLGGAN